MTSMTSKINKKFNYFAFNKKTSAWYITKNNKKNNLNLYIWGKKKPKIRNLINQMRKKRLFRKFFDLEQLTKKLNDVVFKFE